MILSLKTDSPLAHIELFDDDSVSIAMEDWQADRGLAKGLHTHIDELLKTQSFGWDDIKGVIIFRGPGSFTGLRIGITVANALAYGLDVPVVGETGDDWQSKALQRLRSGESDKVVLPHYGSEAHITPPKR